MVRSAGRAKPVGRPDAAPATATDAHPPDHQPLHAPTPPPSPLPRASIGMNCVRLVCPWVGGWVGGWKYGRGGEEAITCTLLFSQGVWVALQEDGPAGRWVGGCEGRRVRGQAPGLARRLARAGWAGWQGRAGAELRRLHTQTSEAPQSRCWIARWTHDGMAGGRGLGAWVGSPWQLRWWRTSVAAACMDEVCGKGLWIGDITDGRDSRTLGGANAVSRRDVLAVTF